MYVESCKLKDLSFKITFNLQLSTISKNLKKRSFYRVIRYRTDCNTIYSMADISPLVSVVLPTYNCAEFLPDSIGSVLSQTYRTYEVIVVDDGSTDVTKEALRPFLDKIRYVDLGQNKGLPAARNTGIQLSRGEYIAFLDADDHWLPEKLKKNVECFQAHPEVGMVYSRHINVDESGRPLGESAKRRLHSGNVFTRLFSDQNFILTSSVMVRKNVFETAGLFDERLVNCQDWDMFLRIAFSYKVAGIYEPLVQYRHNSRSLSKNRNNVLKYQKMVIDKIYTEFRNRENGICEKFYKKRLASHYEKTGRYYLRMGDRLRARESFWQALKNNPFRLRAIRYFLYTLCL